MKNVLKNQFLIASAILLAGPVQAGLHPDTEESLRDTVRMNEVVVTGTRFNETATKLPVSVSIVTGEEMEQRMDQSILPILAERVPSLMITSRSVMGYGVSSGAAGAMTLRGVGGGMLLMIDGHPQFAGIFGHPLPDTYQTFLADRVEVVRGPASMLYGQSALGGVINILTRQQKEDGVSTRARVMYGSYNTLSAEATNMTRFGKFHSVLSFAYNRSDGHRDRMDYEQYSGYAKIGYDLHPNWKSYADLNLSQSYSTNPGSEQIPMYENDMDVLRGVSSFTLSNQYKRTSGAVRVYYNFGDHYINDGDTVADKPRMNRFNSTDWMLGFNAYQTYSLWQGNQLTAGFDFQRYGGHAWTSFLDHRPDSEIEKKYMNDVAGYLNFQQLLWNKLTANAGIRLDHHSVTGNEWVPQFGLSYQASPFTTVKGIVSKGYRNPNIRELYLWGPANPDLKPESLMNYEMAATHSLCDGRIGLELNLYHIKGDNSIISAPDQNSRYRYKNTGKIENYGLEITANYIIKPSLSLNFNYSYLHMEHPIEAAARHKIYLGGNYTLDKWTFATGLQYVNRLITVVADPAKEISAEHGSYLLWNARVGYQILPGMDLLVRGENLLDQSYQMYHGYPMPGATVFGGFSVKI